MKLCSTVTGLAAALVLASLPASVRAGEEKEETVAWSQVPQKVQQAVKAYAAETDIKKIEKSEDDGEAAYEFELEKAGQKSEVKLSSNGELLATEEAVALSDIPEAALKTIQAQAAGGKILSTEKVTTKGKVAYEALIEKDGKKTEIKVKAKGKLVKKEKADEKNDKD